MTATRAFANVSVALKEASMRRLRQKTIATIALAAIVTGQLGTVRTYAREDLGANGVAERDEDEHARTETPIKHVIVIIGENRTFDNVYGTYVPKRGQHVSNLLSKGIVRADGTPGPNSALAEQFRLT